MSETGEALLDFMSGAVTAGARLEAVVLQARDGDGMCAIDPNGADFEAYCGRVVNMICTLAFTAAKGNDGMAVKFLGDASHAMQKRLLGKCGQCGEDA